MVGKIARGAYVFVVATMFVAWIISFNKEAPAKPQTGRPADVVHPLVVSVGGGGLCSRSDAHE